MKCMEDTGVDTVIDIPTMKKNQTSFGDYGKCGLLGTGISYMCSNASSVKRI